VLGGTFDPPHLGHLTLAREAWRQLALDEVRLVPARRAPHKPAPRLDAELRARLVAAAVADQPGLALSRLELDRPEPSFTVDTLEALAAAEPGAELWFLLGADQLVGFARWREPQRILDLARLAVAARAGRRRPELADVASRVAPDRVDWVEMPEVDISSSLVRDRLARGQSLRELVPAAVEALLREEGWPLPA
jgi:nicotinate-nucleotide adenylyltransferase